MNARFAVVDDDPEIASLLATFFEKAGFSVDCFGSGEDFLASPLNHDLVILDIGLPGMDGLEVCRTLRINHNVPIIMLTAASDDVDRILGLELGADDYLGKPFNPRELQARVKALLRRVRPEPANPAGLNINLSARVATWNGDEIGLTGAEFDLLAMLHKHRDVLSRDEISLELKGHKAGAFDRSIDTLSSRLRKKLKEASGHDLVRAVRGRGYALTL